MKIAKLAKKIGDEFNKAVKEAECENFKEMRRLYDWEASDIRSEIEYMVNRMQWGEDEHGEPIYSGCVFFGNEISNIQEDDDDNDMTYGQFKKMVMANVH